MFSIFLSFIVDLLDILEFILNKSINNNLNNKPTPPNNFLRR